MVRQSVVSVLGRRGAPSERRNETAAAGSGVGEVKRVVRPSSAASAEEGQNASGNALEMSRPMAEGISGVVCGLARCF